MRGDVPARCAALAALLGAAACDTAVHPLGGDSDAALSPKCLEAREHSDLEWLQDNVFTPSCSAFTSCHKGTASQAARLNLEDGRTEEMIGKRSRLIPWWILVVPGHPEQSYLMVQLGRVEGPLCVSGTMPYRNPVLCKDKIDAIERWITGLEEPGPDAGPPDGGIVPGPDAAARFDGGIVPGPDASAPIDGGPDGGPDAGPPPDAPAADAAPIDAPPPPDAAPVPDADLEPDAGATCDFPDAGA